MDNNRLVYAEHKDRFAHIGVDLFRDTQTENVWRIEHSDEDNTDYIVRTNFVDDMSQQISSSHWKAIPDRTGSNITLFYKDTPVKRFASNDYKFTKETVNSFAQFLVQKVEGSNFREKMFKTMSQAKVDALLTKYAELKK